MSMEVTLVWSITIAPPERQQYFGAHGRIRLVFDLEAGEHGTSST